MFTFNRRLHKVSVKLVRESQLWWKILIMGLDKSTNGQDHQNFISHKNHSRLMQTISKTSMAYFQLNNFFAHNNKSKIQSSLMQKYVVHGHKSSTFSLLSSSPRASMNNLNVNGIARLPWQPWQNMWCCSLLETLRNEYDVWIPIYAKQRRFTIEKNGSSSLLMLLRIWQFFKLF